jgi:hypothetical protein
VTIPGAAIPYPERQDRAIHRGVIQAGYLQAVTPRKNHSRESSTCYELTESRLMCSRQDQGNGIAALAGVHSTPAPAGPVPAEFAPDTGLERSTLTRKSDSAEPGTQVWKAVSVSAII